MLDAMPDTLTQRLFRTPERVDTSPPIEDEAKYRTSYMCACCCNPDFAALARDCGGVGFKAEYPGELREAISQTLKAEGLAIVDCVAAAGRIAQAPASRSGSDRQYSKAKIKQRSLQLLAGDRARQ